MGRAKERREVNAFVAEGVRLVEEAINAAWKFQFALYSDGLSERGSNVLNRLRENKIEVDEVAGVPRIGATANDVHFGIVIGGEGDAPTAAVA